MKLAMRVFWRAQAALLGFALLLAGCTSARPPADSVSDYVDDAAITTSVKVHMLQDGIASARSIGVHTLNGTVLLTGRAQSLPDKHAAETIARTTPHVREVLSRIVVSEQTP